MKIFLSWSGERSRSIAEALHDWLPSVIQAVCPFMSANDLEKGTRWREGLAGELESSSVSIICLTPENLESPWIHFEAGALSKQQHSSYVCTLLFGIDPVDVREPLAQFQATKADKQDIKKLVQTVNRLLGDDALADNKINETFEVWWSKLEERLNGISTPDDIPQHHRDVREILQDILELVRHQVGSQHRFVSALKGSSRLPSTVSWQPEEAQTVYDVYQIMLGTLEEARSKQEPQENIDELEKIIEEICTDEKKAAEMLGVLNGMKMLGKAVKNYFDKKSSEKDSSDENSYT
jgi:hypothetical protein